MKESVAELKTCPLLNKLCEASQCMMWDGQPVYETVQAESPPDGSWTKIPNSEKIMVKEDGKRRKFYLFRKLVDTEGNCTLRGSLIGRLG